MRFPNVALAVVNVAGTYWRRAERHWRTAAHAAARGGKLARRQLEIVSTIPARTRATMVRGKGEVVRARNRAVRFDDHVLTPYRTETRVKKALARAGAGAGPPVIAGPWTSEVGYEALYWLPFLRWAADRYAVPSQRIIALSRGGTASWYSGIADRYVEIFDLIDPGELAAEAASRRERGDQKQMAATDFDRRLIALAGERLGITNAVVWQPGLMYQLYRPFWYGDRSLDFLFRHAGFERMAAPPVAGIQLPPEYAAVKFYTGAALPDTTENRETLYRFVERLAARIPVVMLDTAWSLDEHQDYAFEGIPGVTTLRPSLDPKTNLDLQTRVIGGARLFLGTCGGLAWLAPLMGVETLAVYQDDRYLVAHMYAARYAYRRTGAARFSTLSVKALRAVSA